jgi:hypothetical protein
MRSLSPHTRAALLAALSFLCVTTCAAQKPQEKQAAAPPTGLALEVDTKGRPVSHQPVPGAFFGGVYRRLPDWQAPAGAQRFRTFKLTNAPEGEAVRIKVFAVLDRFHDQEVLLGDYLLLEGEKAAVEGMRHYGYEPMEVKVVKVSRLPNAAPVAVSKVPSVAVVGVEEKQANFPTYKVSLRNLSDKDITYLEVHTYERGKHIGTGWPRAEQNRPLAKAGESFEVSARGGGRGLNTPEGYAPSAPERVEIVSAVFADESYEGEPHSAVSQIAALRGQKMQITRALALWGSAGAGEGADARAALDEFERRVLALDREAPAALGELLADVPGVAQEGHGKLRVYVEGGLDFVRKELLKDIREYRQAAEAGGRPYDAWLGDLRKKYEGWLSRL